MKGPTVVLSLLNPCPGSNQLSPQRGLHPGRHCGFPTFIRWGHIRCRDPLGDELVSGLCQRFQGCILRIHWRFALLFVTLGTRALVGVLLHHLVLSRGLRDAWNTFGNPFRMPGPAVLPVLRPLVIGLRWRLGTGPTERSHTHWKVNGLGIRRLRLSRFPIHICWNAHRFGIRRFTLCRRWGVIPIHICGWQRE